MPGQALFCACQDCQEHRPVKLAEQQDGQLVIMRRARGKTHKLIIPYQTPVPIAPKDD